uniref:Uncharacterized protein n=2 Tax=Amphimedon queenslandica TaxID=400682 RepID=A0A1X7TDW9_AMPQE
MASNRKTYIRIRSKAQAKELRFHGYFCCGPSLEAIVTPWCPLIPQDAPPPHSVPYMQMHLMKESTSDTVDGIYQIYKDKDKLEVLFIIATREEQQQPFSPPDLRFRTIYISRRHRKDVLELVEKGHDLEATLNITESKSEFGEALFPKESEIYTALLHAVHYVIENRVIVSLALGIPEICPDEKRLLSFLLKCLNYQYIEEHVDLKALYSSVDHIFHLLQQPIHFDYMFPKDFIFYIAFAYTNYTNESVEKNAHVVMLQYLHKLKNVPIETVAKQVTCFLSLGDFLVNMGFISNICSVFDHTVKSFLKHCELYVKAGGVSELFHVALLSISIAVKINNSADIKLKSKKKYDNIWNKRLTEYYKSGFNQVELRCLEEGLKAMTIILEGSPHLMAGWKDFYVIFSSKVHTFETMKEFITQSVKYLIRSGEDVSFRIDFLQPLTYMCSNASRKKKMASYFSVDANNVINEGKEFLACLISLIDEQKWNGYDYYTILENWMRIIFNLIDLSEQLHESQLLQWIREGQINSSYFDYEYSLTKK